MTHYIVHIYREVRLTYETIEADTAQAAAAIALDQSVGAADDIDDCDGQAFAALVDVAGDQQFKQSVTIDFEAERLFKAVPELLDACLWMMHELCQAWDEPEEQAIPERFRFAIAMATAERRLP